MNITALLASLRKGGTTVVQTPEALNKHYHSLFMDILRASIPEHDKIEKRRAGLNGTIETFRKFDSTGGLVIGTARVGATEEHAYFKHELSLEEIGQEIEAVVRSFAGKLVSAVETLIGKASIEETPFCTQLTVG
jgi:hypothetical protein